MQACKEIPTFRRHIVASLRAETSCVGEDVSLSGISGWLSPPLSPVVQKLVKSLPKALLERVFDFFLAEENFTRVAGARGGLRNCRSAEL